MKRVIVIVAFMAIAFMANAQSFTIDKGELLWQHKFDADLNATDIVKAMHMSGKFTDIEIIDTSFIAATIMPIATNYENLGYRRMNIPLYVSNNDFGPSKVIIQIQPGSYRATVINIRLTGISSSTLNGGTLKLYALTDGKFDPIFLKEPVDIYHTALMNLLTFEQVENDW